MNNSHRTHSGWKGVDRTVKWICTNFKFIRNQLSTDAAKLHCMIVPHLSYLNIGGKQEKDDLAHFIENMSQNIEQIAIELSSLVTEVTVVQQAQCGWSLHCSYKLTTTSTIGHAPLSLWFLHQLNSWLKHNQSFDH